MAAINRAPKRAAALLIAVAVAAVGTYAVAQYVSGLEAEATAGAELVEVYVAEGNIPANTPAEAAVNAGLVTRSEVLKRTVPLGAVGALEDLDGTVALTPILPGEVLLHGRFGPPSQAAVSFEIPPGTQAMSFEVSVPIGVANIIESGDRVSLIAHVEREGDAEDDSEASDALGVTASSLDRVVVQPGVALEFKGGWSQFFLQDIEVLAIGERVWTAPEGEDVPDGQIARGQGSVMMTVAVTPEQAELLAMAIFEADIYATLLSDDATPAETSGVTLADLFR